DLMLRGTQTCRSARRGAGCGRVIQRPPRRHATAPVLEDHMVAVGGDQSSRPGVATIEGVTTSSAAATLAARPSLPAGARRPTSRGPRPVTRFLSRAGIVRGGG